MPRRKKMRMTEVIDVLKQTRGMVYVTARQLGIAPQTVYNYIDEFPAVREAFEQQSGEMVDMAELVFYDAIRNKEAWAVSMMLKTKGKKRGYVERTEHDVLFGADEAERLGGQLDQLLEDMDVRHHTNTHANGTSAGDVKSS